MKKYTVIVFVWLMLLGIQVDGKVEPFAYTITYDQMTEDPYELKSKVENRYEDMMKGVAKEDQALLFQMGISSFYVEENLVLEYENHTLNIIQGDGEGGTIHGTFVEGEFCLPEVKPKSLLMEWLGL